jgi:hypothetical protein
MSDDAEQGRGSRRSLRRRPSVDAGRGTHNLAIMNELGTPTGLELEPHRGLHQGCICFACNSLTSTCLSRQHQFGSSRSWTGSARIMDSQGAVRIAIQTAQHHAPTPYFIERTFRAKSHIWMHYQVDACAAFVAASLTVSDSREPPVLKERHEIRGKWRKTYDSTPRLSLRRVD